MAFPAIIAAITPIIDRVLDVIPNPAEKERAKAELLMTLTQMEHEQALEQVKLNQEEAKHPSIWVAGWRPFIGWIGGVGLAWTFIVHPLITWVATVGGYTGMYPELQTDQLMTLVMAMLGMGALRSFDKMNDKDTKVIGINRKQDNFNQ